MVEEPHNYRKSARSPEPPPTPWWRRALDGRDVMLAIIIAFSLGLACGDYSSSPSQHCNQWPLYHSAHDVVASSVEVNGEMCSVVEFREHASHPDDSWTAYDPSEGWRLERKLYEAGGCAYQEYWRTIDRRVECPSGLKHGTKVRNFKTGKQVRQDVEP